MDTESESPEQLDTSGDLDMVTVLRAEEHDAQSEVQIVRGLLEAGGVPCVIVGGPEFPNLPCEVRVPKERFEEALILIAESQSAGPRGAEEAEASTEGQGQP
jgi:hypothetical protein